MSTQLRSFRPLAATQNIAVTTTAQTLALPGAMGTFSVRLCNTGTQLIYFLPQEANNNPAVAATATNAIPLPAGQTEVFTMSPGTTSLSVIAGATGTTLYATVGEGV